MFAHLMNDFKIRIISNCLGRGGHDDVKLECTLSLLITGKPIHFSARSCLGKASPHRIGSPIPGERSAAANTLYHVAVECIDKT